MRTIGCGVFCSGIAKTCNFVLRCVILCVVGLGWCNFSHFIVLEAESTATGSLEIHKSQSSMSSMGCHRFLMIFLDSIEF